MKKGTKDQKEYQKRKQAKTMKQKTQKNRKTKEENVKAQKALQRAQNACTETHLACPHCGSCAVKKNGHVHSTKKQNYQCKTCQKQFCNPHQVQISQSTKKFLIKKLLLERIAIRGICRVLSVSLSTVLEVLSNLAQTLPKDLNVNLPPGSEMEFECDELWSFVGSQKNKQWIWLVLHRSTRQIVAFYIGDRRRVSARALWERIPAAFRASGKFYTDQLASYVKVIPKDQHFYSTRKGPTNHLERFNCTLRQRLSRLVRSSLSFSRKLSNHTAMLAYFLCDYNAQLQEKAAKLKIKMAKRA